MANCTYRFTDANGNERVIEGQAAFKAYLVNGGLQHLLPGAMPAATLSRQRQDINAKLEQKIFSDFDKAVEEYSNLPDTRNGKLLDTDQARELSPEYRADRSLAPKVHEAASAFTQRAFETRMAKAPDGGLVMFMAGGGGAGKSSAEHLLASEMDRANTILDGTLSSYDKAARNIQMALDNNQSVIIAYVYREPVEAMQNGVLTRAMKRGRTVTIDAVVKGHAGSSEVVRRLQETFGNNPDFLIKVIDNSHGPDGAVISTLDEVPVVKYEGLKEKLRNATDTEFKAGRISDVVHKSTTSTYEPSPANGSQGQTTGNEPGNRQAVREANQPGQSGNALSRERQKNPAASRVEGTSADRFKRTEELQQAVADLQEGKITRAEYNRMVDELRPVYPYESVPAVTTPKDARYALATGKGQSPEKAAKYGAPAMALKTGDWAQLRLDIPSYQLHDAWVVSVHTPKSTNREVQAAYDAGPVVGYESVAALKDVTFGMNQKAAAKIATGSAKGTIATMLGKWSPISKADAKARADAAINDPAWTQVGMDPFRHSYFYDRDTMRPVLSADEVIQVGPLVLAKNVKFGQDVDVTGAPIAFSRQRQTETPEFKKWFGDSKVVDDRGEPLVVYRGAYDLAKDGTFFSSKPETANAYAAEEGSFVEPVYMRLLNPLEVDAKGGTQMSMPYKGMNVGMTYLLKEAKKEGHDGIIVRNVADIVEDNGTTDYYVSLGKKAQIKSATGNTGAFDINNPDITQSRQRIVGDSKRAYTPEQKTMFENVGRTVETPTIKERIQSLRKDLGKKLAQGIVDQFRPIKDLSEKAYALARLSKGSAGAFEAFLHHGKLALKDNVYDADQSGGFIERVGVPLHGELEDFMWWIAANRAERLAKEDREHLFTAADIAAGKSLDTGTTEFDYTLQHGPNAGSVTRDRTKIYRDALATFDEFNKNALDIAEQSGLIDPDSRKFWENEFYVPFYRVSDEDGGFVGAKMSNNLVRQRAFKQLKGGTDKLNSDLLANTLQNWGHLIDAGAKNRAAKATLEAAQNVGIAIEADQATVTAMGKALGKKGNVVWFMDGGKERYFLVDDPMVMSAITSLEFAGLRGPIMTALAKPKEWLTIGVTASPAFKIRNLVRDSLQAVASAPLSYNIAKNISEGIKASNRSSQTYVSALASGGLIRFGTMLEGKQSERVRQLVKQGVKDSTILDSESKIKAMYDKYIEPGVMAYNELGNRGEEINRASLFKQLTDQGVDHATAALMARDLMDFSMQGSWNSVRFLTQVVPFMNARLQGLYKLGRAAEEDPKRFAIVLGAVALASIALMTAYSDDDDWKKREDWDRNAFWWFKIGGEAFRIPKPFEIGAIATLAERGLEYFTNPEMTGQRLRKNVYALLADNLSMNPIPQAVKPIMDLYANKDSFTGRPIETMGMERVQPQYRYTQNTSMVARGLSLASGGTASPVQVDHLLKGYFSWLGTFVVGGADMALRPLTGQPTRPTADYWKLATQGIVQDANSGSSRYVSQMYEQAKELEQAYGTYRMLLKEGHIAEAKDFLAENRESIVHYRSVEHVKQAETKYNEMIRIIERSNKDPDEKRALIQQIQAKKDKVARLVAPGVPRPSSMAQ
jgi:hypothetical protein